MGGHLIGKKYEVSFGLDQETVAVEHGACKYSCCQPAEMLPVSVAARVLEELKDGRCVNASTEI